MMHPLMKPDHSATIVFRSPAKYHPMSLLVLALGPVAILVGAWFVLQDDTTSNEEKRKSMQVMAASMAFLLLVYALVLPAAFEVVSDASVNVVTFVRYKWNFGHITGAYDNIGFVEDLTRPKIKFAVDFCTRIIVRRKDRWDLVVSPQDATGFTKAVWDVVGGKSGQANH
jgi:hypothetical protein